MRPDGEGRKRHTGQASSGGATSSLSSRAKSGPMPPPKKRKCTSIPTLTFRPPGFPCALEVPFLDHKLPPVCDTCKKNYKARKLCRIQEGHRALPWKTTYFCITLDETCTEVVTGDNGSKVERLAEGPFAAELLEEPQPYLSRPAGDEKGSCSGDAKAPARSIMLGPICHLCKEKNYTKKLCRDRFKHRQLPWGTTYVRLTRERHGLKGAKNPPTTSTRPSESAGGDALSTPRTSKRRKMGTNMAPIARARLSKSGKNSAVVKKGKAPSTCEASSPTQHGEEGYDPCQGRYPMTKNEPNDDLTVIAPSRSFVVAISSQGRVAKWVDRAEVEHNNNTPAGAIISLSNLQDAAVVAYYASHLIEGTGTTSDPDVSPMSSSASPVSGATDGHGNVDESSGAKKRKEKELEAVQATLDHQNRKFFESIKGGKISTPTGKMATIFDNAAKKTFMPHGTDHASLASGSAGKGGAVNENGGNMVASPQNYGTTPSDPRNLDRVGSAFSPGQDQGLHITRRKYDVVLPRSLIPGVGFGLIMAEGQDSKKCLIQGLNPTVAPLQPLNGRLQNAPPGTIRPGDEVVGVNGVNATYFTFDQIAIAVRSTPSGSPLRLQLLRTEAKSVGCGRKQQPTANPPSQMATAQRRMSEERAKGKLMSGVINGLNRGRNAEMASFMVNQRFMQAGRQAIPYPFGQTKGVEMSGKVLTVQAAAERFAALGATRGMHGATVRGRETAMAGNFLANHVDHELNSFPAAGRLM